MYLIQITTRTADPESRNKNPQYDYYDYEEHFNNIESAKAAFEIAYKDPNFYSGRLCEVIKSHKMED